MNNVIYISLVIVLLVSCGNQKSKNLIYQELKILNKFPVEGESKKVMFVYENDTIETKVKKNQNCYYVSNKKGKRILRKKRFKLTPLLSENDLKTAESILALNNKLRENELIAVKTEILLIDNNTYLFQEEVNKNLIESNKRRDGLIFQLIKHKTKFSIKALKEENYDSQLKIDLEKLIIENEINPKSFSIHKTQKAYELVKSFGFDVIPEYFYLNPLTNKLEPIFYLSLQNGLFPIQSDFFVTEEKIDSTFLKYLYMHSGNILSLINDHNIIEKNIIIPKGFKIVINQGQKIDLINNSSIISYSPWICNGSKDSVITIFSSDSSAKGIHIFHEVDTSIFNFISVKNFNSFSDNYFWTLPSAFTIHEGHTKIYNSHFKNIKSEDAINLFRCSYKMNNSTIENTFSDAFDADFSYGVIINCEFKNCGNDGVDISGGKSTISYSTFLDISDKALSAGEESRMEIYNCHIINSSLSIISKDLSITTSNNNKIQDCQVAYCAFKKKNEFGSAHIISRNDTVEGYERKSLIEFGSSLVINDSLYLHFEEDVSELLYGKVYGKKTIKQHNF